MKNIFLRAVDLLKASHPLKALCMLVGAAFWSATTVAAPDPNFHIYLLLGQSNMEGSANIESQDRAEHPRVRVLQSENCSGISTPYGQWRVATPPLIRCGSGGGLGPGDTFGKVMADAAGEGVTIGLVGGAYGGASIEYFLKNCDAHGACSPPFGNISGAPNGGNGGYGWVLDLAQRAQEVGVIKGFIFHQGESNSGQSSWLERVDQFVADLRSDLGLNADEVPFIAGELPYTGCCIGHNSLVRQIPSRIANGHWVSADGGLRDKGDALHWDAAAVREMGNRYAAKMLEVGNYGPVDCGVQNGTSVCCDISADPDGDGIGEQNDGQQCVVTEDTRGWHPPNPDDVVVALNVGSSGDPQLFDGIWYAADQYATDGTVNATEDTISGAQGSTIFNSERYGDFSYQIPVSSGDYTVQLGMAEIYQTDAGARAFNVDIQGNRVIEGLDIFARVGHDALLLTEPFEVSVYGDRLDIEVTALIDNGTLSSILVREASTGGAASSQASSVSSSASSSGVSTSTPSEDDVPVRSGSVDLRLLVLLFGLLVVAHYFMYRPSKKL